MILLEMMLEVVIGVLVMEVDKLADEVTDMEVDKVADMKIPIVDLTVILEILVFELRNLQKTFLIRLCWLVILIEMMLEVLIGVLVMEVDKVTDEVTNMEVDKVINMMAEFVTNTSYLATKFLTNESGATW